MLTPLEQSVAYAKGDIDKQHAFEDGFVAGMSFQVHKQTEKMLNLETKAQEAWDKATGKK